MAIHIDRVYTRTGDGGETGLAGGARVPKDSLRIESYGTLDELNSCLGLARALLAERFPDAEIDALLGQIQNDLFNAGNELATPPEKWREGLPAVGEPDVTWMEETIDRLGESLEPLRSFVLPGGGSPGAALHLARTVCRRAERIIVALSREEKVRPILVAYLNRLSDLLFVLARAAAKRGGHPEVLWKEGLESHRRKKD
ncbi:MAG: cob(I)yrinic acid a,c-diamide adenosyltransferase [Planctomycetes bacterium]|nr:cob(I)yrinic acid a,c-diamide adenosyltransferase [Planctomycetota bacterium]